MKLINLASKENVTIDNVEFSNYHIKGKDIIGLKDLDRKVAESTLIAIVKETKVNGVVLDYSIEQRPLETLLVGKGIKVYYIENKDGKDTLLEVSSLQTKEESSEELDELEWVNPIEFLGRLMSLPKEKH